MEREDQRASTLAMFQQMKSRINRVVDPLVQTENLTPLQGSVLLEVARGHTSVGAICEQTGMGQANASTLCKKLEQAGVLSRSRNPRDERVVDLTLTEQGWQTLERIRQRLDRYEDWLGQLPDEVLEDIRRGIRAANVALDYLAEQIKGD